MLCGECNTECVCSQQTSVSTAEWVREHKTKTREAQVRIPSKVHVAQ